MPGRPAPAAACPVETLFEEGSVAGLSDDDLVERFLAGGGHRGERAFEALLIRHGPLVRGICRRIVVDSTDADDAFQATFMVLIRRAGSVRVDDSLGRWLAGVARWVAGRVRADRERRRRRERAGAIPDRAVPTLDRPTAEVLGALDGEVARLAEPFRSAVVLWDLGGWSLEQAALDLGCPVGTVKSRLARGRARLKARLTRQGFDAPLGLALLGPTDVPPRLAAATVRLVLAAIGSGSRAGLLGSSVAFTFKDGVAQMIFAAPTQWIAGTALLVAMGATGWTWVADQGGGAPLPMQKPQDRGRPDTAAFTPHGSPEGPKSDSTVRSKRLARQCFGPDSWMTEDIKLTYFDAPSGCYLYAQDYELKESGKRLIVNPFAMIVVSKDGLSHRTVTSSRGVITFDQPFGAFHASSEPTRVKLAELSGDVRIGDDQGTVDDLKDDLSIGPVSFARLDGMTMQVMMMNHVVIKCQNLRGVGAEMIIQLRPEPIIREGEDQPRSAEDHDLVPPGRQAALSPAPTAASSQP